METNLEMEYLRKLREQQPEVYDNLPATTKISLGIYESTKPTTNELTTDDRLRLRGFKQRIAQDNLSPSERTSLALKILELEKNIGENK
jgi:hypothetical protein